MTLPDRDERSDSPPAKRLKVEGKSLANTSNKSSLLDFCDDLMLEIFYYLNPSDLHALSQCCQRLQRVVQDRTLWTNVYFTKTPTNDEELREYVKYLLPCTKLFASKGPWNPPQIPPPEEQGEQTLPNDPNPTFTGELMERISKAAPNLTSLILENHILDAQDMKWEQVPPLLERLSLQSSLVTKCDFHKSFFFGIDKCLPNLKSLNLTKCSWFVSHSLLALSKCKRLEELILADCPLSDFVPYISLGVRFGFKSLSVVDFRRTWITDREVSCLNKVETLRELYLEAPEGERGGTIISDVAVTAFGGSEEVWNRMGYLVLIMSHNGGVVSSALQVLELCNYTYVTNTSLRHCASCLKHIKRVNVKGTSCTQEGVLKFKAERPDVVIVSNFDLELDIPHNSLDNT